MKSRAKGKPERHRTCATSQEQRGCRQAAALGLYVLLDNRPGPDRVWRIYSRKTGQQLGWWQPATGRYFLNGVRGTNHDRLAVLRVAAGGPRGTPPEESAHG